MRWSGVALFYADICSTNLLLKRIEAFPFFYCKNDILRDAFSYVYYRFALICRQICLIASKVYIHAYMYRFLIRDLMI